MESRKDLFFSWLHVSFLLRYDQALVVDGVELRNVDKAPGAAPGPQTRTTWRRFIGRHKGDFNQRSVKKDQ